VHDECSTVAERAPHKLASPNRGLDSRTRQGRGEVFGTAGLSLQSTRITNENVGNPRADEVGDESAADNLDLGKFGHRLAREFRQCSHRSVRLGGFFAGTTARTDDNAITRHGRVKRARVLWSVAIHLVHGFSQPVPVTVFL